MQNQLVKTTTPVWKIDSRKSENEAVAGAAALIRVGGVIIYPTETFYGLGGNPMSEAAIERIYRIKGRDFEKALPLIAADLPSVKRAVARWPESAKRLAEAFWPGALTLILPASSELPSRLHAYTGKIAVRISPHPVARKLSAAAGGLLISTSANIAGRPPSKRPREIAPELLERVDGLIDAGELPGNLPSTIVDLSFDPPRLIREGQVSWERVMGYR